MASKCEILERIRELGIIPVVRAASSDEAMRAVNALCAGGINVLEITLTVPHALSVIEKVVRRYEAEAIVGAGSVLDAETARACILAGAQFVVSPALNVATIEMCKRYSVACLPGALTPTEVVMAWTAGADMVKIFPCSAVGGATYLKSLKAPLPQVALVPTGGVTLQNAADFIKAGATALGIGNDLVNSEALREGKAATITTLALSFVTAVQEARR